MPTPTLPSYVLMGWKDMGEQHKPVVERSEMDRGIPKQRRIAADTIVTVTATLFFNSKVNAENFETWFYSEGMGWFDFTLPRTGAVTQGRIVGGDIGTLVPATKTWAYSQRQVKLEYVRAAL